MESLAQSRKSNLASDRLQRAIERNRARQTKKSSKLPSGPPPNLSSGKQSGSRMSVARPEEAEFVFNGPTPKSTISRQKVDYGPEKKTRAAPVRTTKKTAIKKKRSTSSKIQSTFSIYLNRGVWIFWGVLLLQLIFSDRGVLDFYKAVGHFEKREVKLGKIGVENNALEKEIRLMKINASVQRKLVREHLGHIASDEYLILFSDDAPI